MLRMFPWGQSLRIGIVHLGQKCGDNFFIQRNCVVSSYFVCYLEGDWITSSLKMKILKVVQLGFHSILISLPLTFFYIEKKFYFLWLCSPMLQPIVQFPPLIILKCESLFEMPSRMKTWYRQLKITLDKRTTIQAQTTSVQINRSKWRWL